MASANLPTPDKITIRMRIAYAPCYVLSLPEGHRFPMEKYGLLRDQLLHEGVACLDDFFVPQSMDEQVILQAHEADYWGRTLNGEWSRKEERRSGFPWSANMVARERVIMQGTLDCARHVVEHGGVALNIAGGTHHAYADRAEGFCILNDFALAVIDLLNAGQISSALIVDCDVHQGNGTASMLSNVPQAMTFSMHGASNYPLHKERSDVDVPLPDGTTDDDYLALLETHLDNLLTSTLDLVLYQCGVDVLATDKLGRLGLSMQGCRSRDEMVLNRCAAMNIPVVCAMGGGYSPDVSTVVQAHMNTFRVALDAWT